MLKERKNSNLKSILKKLFFRKKDIIIVDEKIKNLRDGYKFTSEGEIENLKDSFEFINTNKNIQHDIMNYIKPSSRDSLTYKNLYVDYGVYSKEAKIFTTLTYFKTHGICPDGSYSNDYEFIVRFGDIEDKGVYFHACTSCKSIKSISPRDISIFIKIDEEIKRNIKIKVFAAILAFYDYNKEYEFIKKQKECNPKHSYHSERKKLIKDYIEEHGW